MPDAVAAWPGKDEVAKDAKESDDFQGESLGLKRRKQGQEFTFIVIQLRSIYWATGSSSHPVGFLYQARPNEF